MPQLRFFSDSTRKDKEVHFDDPQSEAAGEAAESALRPCGSQQVTWFLQEGLGARLLQHTLERRESGELWRAPDGWHQSAVLQVGSTHQAALRRGGAAGLGGRPSCFGDAKILGAGASREHRGIGHLAAGTPRARNRIGSHLKRAEIREFVAAVAA